MELARKAIDIFLNLDTHLDSVIQGYGAWTYFILFGIVFCETGLVITPFLPGDSLLFAVGTFAARGSLDLCSSCALLILAAVAGDTVNYWIGSAVGPRVFHGESRLLNRRHLQRTHDFYEKHGGKTIILARFIPVIRTFAPFVAGIGSMTYGRFVAYNVFGGAAWVLLFLLGGFWFGNLPVVKRNFTLVIMVIIVISIMPGVVEFIRSRARRRGRQAPSSP